jgi:tRNA-splicing endonuclease subunit Sen34
MKSPPDLPIAISQIGGRYFLFSADVASYLRQEHRICGVLVGSIPQIPQQNVFLGLPLELMPEEAQLLVAKNVAYIVDDVSAHEEGLRNLDICRRQDYLAGLRQAGEKAAKSQAEFKGQKRELALKKRGLTPKPDDVESEEAAGGDETPDASELTDPPQHEDVDQSDSLFTPPSPPPNTTRNNSSRQGVHSSALALTPATSQALLPPPRPGPSPLSLNLPPSYPLFAHLHSKGYFLSPGLRFGCQYVVYPGDPLRFHSHFLAVAADWDQEIDLMDIVGGGRLGTGVKKGYLIGGVEPGPEEEEEGEVRTFSVEWAVM